MLGHRDQSWGPRSLASLRSHAWLAGTCGDHLSFTTENLVAEVGEHIVVVRSGFVVTDGTVDIVTGPDLVYGLGWDMRTPVDVHGTITTASGTSYVVSTLRSSPTFRNHRTMPEGAPGVLTATDTLFEVRIGDQVGIACFNVVTNQTAGLQEITMLATTPKDDGVWFA
jgi:hypothetical protein